MTIRTYASPVAFKQALEQRLRFSGKSGAEMQRRRQLVVFDRYLARVVAVLGDAATLKGGLALEIRLERARSTKDIDLRMVGSPHNILAKLQEAGRRDVSDFMTFEVGRNDAHPEMQNDGMQYDGLRFRAECKLAGKLYGQPFGVDVAFGDPILGEPEVVVAEDVLGFAGIAPPKLRIYPVETHVAEKLHAYTLPRARPNSRVKGPSGHRAPRYDPDAGERAGPRGARADLYVPQDPRTARQAPRAAASVGYALRRNGTRGPAPLAGSGPGHAQAFLDPVLAAELDAVWEPDHWSWRSG